MKLAPLPKNDIYNRIGNSSIVDDNGTTRKYAWSYNDEDDKYYLILINPQNEQMVRRYSTNGQDWRPKPYNTLIELHADFIEFCKDI